MFEESHEFLTWPVEIETSDSLIGTYTVLVLGINPIQRHVVTAQQLLPLMYVPSLPDLPFNTVNFCNAFQLLIEYNKRAMTKHLNVFQDSDQSIISLMPSFVALQAPITSRERTTSHQSRTSLPVCQFIISSWFWPRPLYYVRGSSTNPHNNRVNFPVLVPINLVSKFVYSS
ncbi:hypothetical protein RCL1_000935 [Eukaryota sp. TZLM3-RCL]